MEYDPWTQSLVNAMSTMWNSVGVFIPRLFGALIVVLILWDVSLANVRWLRMFHLIRVWKV